MFKAAVESPSRRRGTPRIDWIPFCATARMYSGQRRSIETSGTYVVVPVRMAVRQGPSPKAYWSSSISRALGLLQATVTGFFLRTTVTLQWTLDSGGERSDA